MGDVLVQQGMTFHSILQQKLQLNLQRLQQIRKFSINVGVLFGQFSKDISVTCRQLLKKLKNDQEEDENIIFLSKYIFDIMNELSKKVEMISGKMQNQIIEPLSQFIQNQNLTNKMVLRESQEIIYSLQSNNEFLKQLSKNFDSNSKVGSKKTKEEMIEYSQIYEMEMQRCNQKWQTIKIKCQQILFKIDSYNCSRCNFTTKQQISFIKMINKLVGNDEIQDSISQYEEINFQSIQLSQQIKDSIRQKIGKLNLLEDKPLQIQSIHSFNQKQLSTKYSHQKRIIDDFVSVFTSKTNIKQENRDFQEARSLILDKIQWIKYFLNKMQSSLHTQINLPIVKYRQLTALLKYIFAHAAQIQEQNQYILYSVLYISYRIRYNDDYLIKDIGKQQDYWKNTKIWFKLIEYVKKSKYSYKQLYAVVPQKIQNYIKSYGGKIFSKDLWKIRRNDKKVLQKKQKQKSEKMIIDARDYDIMCEMNYFMIKLQLEQKFIFNFILEASEKYNFSQENMKKLIKYHYFNRISNNNKIGSNYLKRKKRLEKKYNSLSNFQEKFCTCVGKSLQYLSIKADKIIDLRRVNKYWAQKLKKRIFQRYLIHQINLNSKTRLRIYKQIAKLPFNEQVYRRMIKQMPQISQNTQIIYLDAKRSLSWDQSLRVKLMQILGVYAFYHSDVGYLQGMNYLCENILKLTTNTFDVYSIFQHLMNNHYSNMYTGKFDGLKIKIYQMMRIIQRQNPVLYNHFQAQKVEGQHFLLSWAITLWGQMSGQLSWILWDGFVVKGWKWWIKTCLWLLRCLQGELLKMNFEQIMKTFSNLSAQFFCMQQKDFGSYGIQKNKIKTQIDNIHIESDILKDIEKEYQMKINLMNEFLQKIQKRKK